jgi:virulence-associated protein VagC
MSSPVETAKVFMTGRSQAVRLPKSCRFDADEVEARRVGRSVVLTPKNDDWASAVRALFEGEGEGAKAELRRAPQWKQRARTPLR